MNSIQTSALCRELEHVLYSTTTSKLKLSGSKMYTLCSPTASVTLNKFHGKSDILVGYFSELKKQGLRVSLLLICTFLFLFGLEFFGFGISTKTYDSKPD